MDEKIKSAKIAILTRIEKAVSDETKSLSVETLTAMSDIVNSFDIREMERKVPNYAEVLKEILDKAKDKPVAVVPAETETEGI